MLEILRRRLAELAARLASLREQRTTSRAAAEAIAATAEARAEGQRSLTIEETTAFNGHLHDVRARDGEIATTLAEHDQIATEIRELEEADERERRAQDAYARAGNSGRPTPPTPGSWAMPDPDEVRGMSERSRAEHATRAMDRANSDGFLSERNQEHLAKLFGRRSNHFNGDYVAQRLLLTESMHYRSAFQKWCRWREGAAYTVEESRALAAFQDFEMRAASEGTTTAGGFGVPVVIDPTIILTSGAADVPMLRIARIEPVTTNVWKGVSSAAATWSTDAEGVEVSDDMTTLAQPSVTVYNARGFIPYTFEVAQDYPSFATEIQALLEQGYIDYLAVKTATGSGTNDLWGVFTAIVAGGTTVQVTSTTDGAFGAVDIFNTWNALPERFRMRASWFMSVSIESQIRQFSAAGTNNAYFTVDLTADGISRINGRPVYLSDYAPAFSTTTGAATRFVVGDFRHYLIAQRQGMTFETVQHLLSLTTNLPNLQRGKLGWARVGADSIADNAFRVQVNT